MSYLRPTPPDRLVDESGRPYFLWDGDLTIDQFRAILAGDDRVERARMIGKLMREARPDDVFTFVRPDDIRAEWAGIEKHLGRRREFWRWLLDRWKELGVA